MVTSRVPRPGGGDAHIPGATSCGEGGGRGHAGVRTPAAEIGNQCPGCRSRRRRTLPGSWPDRRRCRPDIGCNNSRRRTPGRMPAARRLCSAGWNSSAGSQPSAAPGGVDHLRGIRGGRVAVRDLAPIGRPGGWRRGRLQLSSKIFAAIQLRLWGDPHAFPDHAPPWCRCRGRWRCRTQRAGQPGWHGDRTGHTSCCCRPATGQLSSGWV